MDNYKLINYIDELHHNRDFYSRSKLLTLIKNKIRSLSLEDEDNWIDIDDKIPDENSQILYQGNLGEVEGIFICKADEGIGLARLNNGNTDVFDKWKYHLKIK